MTTQPIESHEVHSARLLGHAREMLAKGDRLQASEKVWGAVAHGIKALAEETRVALPHPPGRGRDCHACRSAGRQ